METGNFQKTWTNIIKAYDYIILAINTKDERMKWLFFGRTTGYFFRGLIKS